MWSKLGNFILKYRWQSLVFLALLTVFFGYYAVKVQLTYDFAKIIPADDEDYIEYVKFKQTFGEDGNILVVGVQSDKIFDYPFFTDWTNLSDKIEKINGVEKVLSLSKLYNLTRNDSLQKLELKPLLQQSITNQSELDSFQNQVDNLKFYNGLLYNPTTQVTLIAITLKKDKLDSKERIPLVAQIEEHCEVFAKKHQRQSD